MFRNKYFTVMRRTDIRRSSDSITMADDFIGINPPAPSVAAVSLAPAVQTIASTPMAANRAVCISSVVYHSSGKANAEIGREEPF